MKDIYNEEKIIYTLTGMGAIGSLYSCYYILNCEYK